MSGVRIIRDLSMPLGTVFDERPPRCALRVQAQLFGAQPVPPQRGTTPGRF